MNAMRRAYLARSAGRTVETGKPFLRFVTPGDVRDLKNRIDPYVRALDAAVATCAGLPAGIRDGWKAFSSSAWRPYFDEDDSWWHTAAQMDQGEAYSKDVERWQQMITGYKCAPNAPPITPQDPPGSGGEEWAGAIKWVAIAGIAVAVVIGAKAVVR